MVVSEWDRINFFSKQAENPEDRHLLMDFHEYFQVLFVAALYSIQRSKEDEWVSECYLRSNLKLGGLLDYSSRGRNNEIVLGNLISKIYM